LLSALYSEILIPKAVYEEVVEAGRGRPGSKEVREAKWIKTVAVKGKTAVLLLRSSLGAGESEAIVLAMEMKADLILLDDRKATKIAESMGLKKAGTIGTLIAAKRRGLIPSVTLLLDQLLAVGVRISRRLYRYAQQLAGEEREH
jgi:hypothetical protein